MPKTTRPASSTSADWSASALWKPAQKVESRYQHMSCFALNLIVAPSVIGAIGWTAPLGLRGLAQSNEYSMCAAFSFVVLFVASDSVVTSMIISTSGHSAGSRPSASHVALRSMKVMCGWLPAQLAKARAIAPRSSRHDTNSKA